MLRRIQTSHFTTWHRVFADHVKCSSRRLHSLDKWQTLKFTKRRTFRYMTNLEEKKRLKVKKWKQTVKVSIQPATPENSYELFRLWFSESFPHQLLCRGPRVRLSRDRAFLPFGCSAFLIPFTGLCHHESQHYFNNLYWFVVGIFFFFNGREILQRAAAFILFFLATSYDGNFFLPCFCFSSFCF